MVKMCPSPTPISNSLVINMIPLHFIVINEKIVVLLILLFQSTFCICVQFSLYFQIFISLLLFLFDPNFHFIMDLNWS